MLTLNNMLTRSITAHEAVANGAALLDQHYPDWRTQINGSALDIADCTACVLGQLYGDYTSGVHHFLAADATDLDVRRDFILNNGFHGTDPVDDARLAVEWRAVLG